MWEAGIVLLGVMVGFLGSLLLTAKQHKYGLERDRHNRQKEHELTEQRDRQQQRVDLIARLLGILEEIPQACLIVVGELASSIHLQVLARKAMGTAQSDRLFDAAKAHDDRASRATRDAFDTRRRLVEALGQARLLFDLDDEATRLIPQIIGNCWTREPGIERHDETECEEWANRTVRTGVQIVAALDIDARWARKLGKFLQDLNSQLPPDSRAILPTMGENVVILSPIAAGEAIRAAGAARPAGR